MNKEALINCRDNLLLTNCKMRLCSAIQNAYFALGYTDRIVFIDNHEKNMIIKEDMIAELNEAIKGA